MDSTTLHDMLADLHGHAIQAESSDVSANDFGRAATEFLLLQRKRKNSVMMSDYSYASLQTSSVNKQAKEPDLESNPAIHKKKRIKTQDATRIHTATAAHTPSLLEKLEQERQQLLLESKKSELLKYHARKLSSLQRLYLFGLDQISHLQDLRQAPDAILPGNLDDDMY